MSDKRVEKLLERMKAGDDHYRAYVGPPARYGFLTLSQMSLLSALGLRETDKVLDFGCGSLRLGRCLIPFLHSGNYYGIEPNDWLVNAGFEHEVGNEIRGIKKPNFSSDPNFDCSVFEEKFDFIVAQSIITHSGKLNTQNLFKSAEKSLKDDGVMLLSYCKADDEESIPLDPWTYPTNVKYSESWLRAECESLGLYWSELAWEHPGATWAIIVRNVDRLPPVGCGIGNNGIFLQR